MEAERRLLCMDVSRQWGPALERREDRLDHILVAIGVRHEVAAHLRAEPGVRNSAAWFAPQPSATRRCRHIYRNAAEQDDPATRTEFSSRIWSVSGSGRSSIMCELSPR